MAVDLVGAAAAKEVERARVKAERKVARAADWEARAELERGGGELTVLPRGPRLDANGWSCNVWKPDHATPKVLTESDKLGMINAMLEKLERLVDGSDDPAGACSPPESVKTVGGGGGKGGGGKGGGGVGGACYSHVV
jgi:hypothetical protein